MKRLFAILLVMAMFLLSFSSFAQSVNVLIPTQTLTASTYTSNTYYGTSQCSAGHFIVTVYSWTSGTYTVHIQAQDPASLNWYDILVSTALGAAGTTVLKVFPNITIVPNGAAADFLPAQWRLYLVGGSTPNMTLSVGLNCKGLT